MTNTTRTIMEGIVDVAAIVGLIVLGCFHVVSGDAILPLIAIIAGGSIGARVLKRSPASAATDATDDPGDGPPPSSHSSILVLALAPFLGLVLHRAGAFLLVVLVLGVSVNACGASSADTARRTTAAASCSSLLVAIGEAPDVPPARAEADRQAVHAICARYVGAP